MASLKRIIPAPIGDEMTENVKKVAKQVFEALDCKGLVRIDFMLDRHSDNFYITEINSIPGSLSYYLWSETGLPYDKLIDEMVRFALRAKEEKEQNNFAFSSDILSGVSLGGTKGTKGSKLKM